MCLLQIFSTFKSLQYIALRGLYKICQTEGDFWPFSQNFESILEKLSEHNLCLLVDIEKFNTKPRHLYSQDTNNCGGISVESISIWISSNNKETLVYS